VKADSQHTIAAIQTAADRLRSEVSSAAWIQHAARESLLHPDSLRVWLDKWLGSIAPDGMAHLVATATRNLGGRVTTLAPGNVPIVAAECIVVGLLAGVHHRVALSTRASSVATRFLSLLSENEPELAERVELRRWRELGDSERQSWLSAPRIVVYGSADTVEWVAARASSTSALVPHGPSLAVGIAASTQNTDWIRAFANDVSTYDQRGCRSPHVLLVTGSQHVPNHVLKGLSAAFSAIDVEAPRGPTSEAETASLFLDDLTSQVLGSVLRGDGWRITIEESPKALRASPLGRTIRVVPVPAVDQIPVLLETLPAPVGLVVTPNGELPNGLQLASGVEVGPMGSAQKPPFERLHDGRHRLDELLMA